MSDTKKLKLTRDPNLGSEDAILNQRIISAVILDRQKSIMMGEPIAEFDRIKRKSYLLYPDGRKEYVGEQQ